MIASWGVGKFRQGPRYRCSFQSPYACIRSVEVRAVNLALIGEHQRFESVVILAVDDGVERPVAATLDGAGGAQAGVDRVAELGHDDEIARRPFGRLGLAARVVPRQIGDTRRPTPLDSLHPPQAFIQPLV